MTIDRPWMIYGAYGYTGELIARQAAHRGLTPLLAGRREQPLASLAGELGLGHRCFDLDDPAGVRRELDTVVAVLHCAGPFIRTSRSLTEACLDTGTHYLDITGEIGVFESIFRRHEKARAAGVVLLPGAGFDVVPSDCLAAVLSATLPDAIRLQLAFTSDRGAWSRGTLTTMIEAFPLAGAERIDGKLVQRPAAFATREIEFSCGRRWVMAIPWGDLSTGYRTTGIANIRTYVGAPRAAIDRLRRARRLLPLLGLRPIKKALQWWVRRRVSGPGEELRRSARTYLWGEVSNPGGETRTATLETPEAYSFTATVAVECTVRVLAGEVEPGASTPASAFGADYVKSFPGVTADW